MTTGNHRPSTKLTRAPILPTKQYKSSNKFEKTHIPTVKDLRKINLLDEFYSAKDEKTNIQETVEVIPQPDSYERVFYSYIDHYTDTRLREFIQLNQDTSIKSIATEQIYANDDIIKLLDHMKYDQRFKLDFYSTTLFIFPKQRNEKFISEIRYTPEHITVKYKTSLELLAATLSSDDHFYQNIDDLFQTEKDIFYRI